MTSTAKFFVRIHKTPRNRPASEHCCHHQPAPRRPQHRRKSLLQQHAEEKLLDNSNFNRQPDKAEGRSDSQNPHRHMCFPNVVQPAP
jgi:hypothetical protein